MIEASYAILVLMLTAFLVLEGWDFGAGLLHFVVGRNERDRGVVIAAIGPLWIWHEVWLVAFGGMTFVFFPAVMASAFAGYYLALFLLLWCLILRGVAIEARGHMRDALWREAWDFAFATSNLLLSVLIGVALGNVIRGEPLDADGNFTLSFFTDFGVHGEVGILDWYTISIGIFTVALFAAHGASYLAWRTEGTVHDRSERLARCLWPAVLTLLLGTAVETARVRQELFTGMIHRPLAWLALACVAGGGLAALVGQWRRRESAAVAGSCVLISGLMAAGAVGVFPVMLHSTLAAGDSVTAYRGAADARGLRLALSWWPVAFVLAVSYFVFVFRYYRGKVRADTDAQGY
ncbi:MAG: cytochrome d ubiquinol oxidase subunit II [Opitutaceae bacterium]|jgi:cytochrome d ubiquinol oxidase subunit II